MTGQGRFEGLADLGLQGWVGIGVVRWRCANVDDHKKVGFTQPLIPTLIFGVCVVCGVVLLVTDPNGPRFSNVQLVLLTGFWFLLVVDLYVRLRRRQRH